MRVAIFHDYMGTVGGGERACLSLAKALGADLFTTDFNPEVLKQAGAERVKVTNLGNLVSKPPLRQIQASLLFAGVEVHDYDFHVFSGNWSKMAGKAHRPNILYCHSPVRAFYDLRERYLGELRPPQKMLAMAWIAAHSHWDKKTIEHMDGIATNSENVRRRIQRYYGRDATVVYGPVTTGKFYFGEVGNYWLSVNRIRPEKRIEMQVEVFRRLPRERLLIVGDTQREEEARRLVSTLALPPNVELVGAVGDRQLIDLYAGCRGLITTAIDEDFGLTPVEAMASGKAVVATDEGGYRETVVNNETGWLLPATVDAFVGKIGALKTENLEAMRERCLERAKNFDEGMFIGRMRSLINAILEESRMA